jgi:hypothetical protein
VNQRTALAVRPARAVAHIVAEVNVIRNWIDEQIREGRTDTEIVAMAPVAIAFINDDITFSDLEKAVKEGLS